MKRSAPTEPVKPLDSRNLMTAPTEYRNIRYEERKDVAYLTLNRPEVINCLSTEMSDEMVHAFARIRKSSELKIVVIKGAGKNFCSGDDLKEMANGVWGTTHQYFERVRYYQQMAYDLEELDKVTIAAIDGYAVGGGLEITMCCDFAIATQRAKWGMPEVDWGITPGWGGTTRMARLVGRRLTKEINMLAAIHPAKKAVQVGLWNRVVPNGQLDEEVGKLITLIRAKSQQTLRQLKYIINKGVECDLYTAQAMEAMSAAWTASVNGWWQVPDADQGKGLAAFRDKTALQKQRRGLGSDFWVDK